MLKIIGAIMICCGSAAIGISASNRINRRIRLLNEWLGILDVMHSEIQFLLTPLTELMEKCSTGASSAVSDFFVHCMSLCREVKDISFFSAWSTALKERDFFGFEPAERQILIELGKTLGRYDAEEQSVRIEHLRASLETRTRAAEGEKNRVGKLYGSLGAACGIALVIVFI